MSNLSFAMYRATGNSASGQLETGEYIYVSWNEVATTMHISDGTTVSARYFQRSVITGRLLANSWLSAFLEIASFQRSSGFVQTEGSIAGRLSETNQASFARIRGNKMSLVIAEGNQPVLDRSCNGVFAAFTQKVIAPVDIHDVLAIWTEMYKKTIK